ncbi:zinc finger (C3HC4-type RING finger) family protein [Zea mays]|uniref:RING-type E3 ubiquitin transferase n=1 Tax=Zea mays TaxID=4577 RepID=A0A1D6IP41_MAIZE|nr:zinc finger (C3HC4-type RING finger) family protein [Zea mays]
MASRDAASSPKSAPRRHGPAAPKNGADLLSPRFRSAAALAGWDEESVLLAAMVVDDTPVRDSRRKRRASTSSVGGSAGSSTRKRRPRRLSPAKIPPVVFALDDEKSDTAAGFFLGSNRFSWENSCYDFCMRCLRHAAAKCGKRCPKCRQFISSSSKSCTINTVLWNTIQLLFPSEVEARKGSSSSPSPCDKDDVRANRFSQGGPGMRTRSRSSGSGFISSEGRTRSSFIEPGASANFIVSTYGSARSSNSRRGFVPASQLLLTRLEQSEDAAALAYRLQQEEFVNAFEEPEQERQPRDAVSTARDTLRAMASRAIRLRARGWPV